MNDFLSKYDDGSMKFDPVDFRVGANLELGFKIYSKGNGDFKKENLYFNDGRNIYVHFAIDRSFGDIICPFDSKLEFIENLKGYGTLLILSPEGADFQLRIAHMNKISLGARKAILEDIPLKAGEYLGKTGTAGIGTGPHSHVECVSIGKTSDICNEIIKKKGLSQENKLSEISESLPAGEKEELRNYCHARDFVMFNENMCIRNDGFIPKGQVTYYSTLSLFGL
jgi:hypothetical protein